MLMKLRNKALIFYLTYLGGGVALAMVVAISQGSTSVLVGAFLGWFHFFAVSQFFILRCPYCDHCAFFTPEGGSTPFVGSRCRHCGKPY